MNLLDCSVNVTSAHKKQASALKLKYRYYPKKIECWKKQYKKYAGIQLLIHTYYLFHLIFRHFSYKLNFTLARVVRPLEEQLLAYNSQLTALSINGTCYKQVVDYLSKRKLPHGEIWKYIQDSFCCNSSFTVMCLWQFYNRCICKQQRAYINIVYL